MKEGNSCWFFYSDKSAVETGDHPEAGNKRLFLAIQERDVKVL